MQNVADENLNIPDPDRGHDEKLVLDLQRLIEYSTSSKSVEIPADTLDASTKALQEAKSSLSESGKLSQQTEMNLYKSIDLLAPKIYPATLASLEIAELMEVGSRGGTAQQVEIRNRVKGVISSWRWLTIIALALSISVTVSNIITEDSNNPNLASLHVLTNILRPALFGMLGACTYILRGMLNNLAAKTFVLRDSTTYSLRTVLGTILGSIIPSIILGQSTGPDQTAYKEFIIAFLSGYAVEPMFTALDNLVAALTDFVGHLPGGASASPK